jgi:hypothetical protein
MHELREAAAAAAAAAAAVTSKRSGRTCELIFDPVPMFNLTTTGMRQTRNKSRAGAMVTDNSHLHLFDRSCPDVEVI